MFKTILGTVAVGVAACVIVGSAIGVTASVAKQIYEKQYAHYKANQAKKAAAIEAKPAK